MIDLLGLVGLYVMIAGQYTLLLKNYRELTRLKAETRMCPLHPHLGDFNGS